MLGGINQDKRGPFWSRPGAGWSVLLTVPAALLVGIVVTVIGPSGDSAVLMSLWRTGQITGSVVLFGAGVIQLFSTRLEHDPGRTGLAAGLVVLGLTLASVAALGPLLHPTPESIRLSPLGAAVGALLALAVGCAGTSRAVRRPELLALAGVATGSLLLVTVIWLRVHGHLLAADSPAGTIAVELGVAVTWLGAGVHETRSQAAGVRGRLAPLLFLAGLLWVVRALAVLAPVALGVAATVLLVALGTIAMSRAAADLGTLTDVDHDQALATSAELRRATAALTEHDSEDRRLRHEARNSLCALRLTTQTLTRHGEGLDPETRDRLTEALSQEVGHLGELLDPPSSPRAVA